MYDFFSLPNSSILWGQWNRVDTQVKYVDLSKYKIMVTVNPEIKEKYLNFICQQCRKYETNIGIANFSNLNTKKMWLLETNQL